MLDIIVPVYRAKKTLYRLLESIAKVQARDKLSLILVFDCDGENYNSEIAFAIAHFRTTPVFLPKNVGPGSARQAGIDTSISEHMMFADADDYFCPDALDSVIKKLENSRFDILFTGFRYERDNEVKNLYNSSAWLHGKIYRRKFLRENNIHFGPYRTNEDNGFNRLALFYKPKVVFDSTVTYVYSENPDSITRSNMREYKFSGLESLAQNYVWAANEYIKNCDNCDFNLVASALLCLLLAMYYYYLDFQGVFEVEKILAWSKEAYELYARYSRNLSPAEKSKYLDIYSKEYSDMDRRISFDEFLAKITDKSE